MHTLGEYLIILDAFTVDQWVHIYDKNTFRYITSAIKKGRGPGEAVMGTSLTTNEVDRTFFLSDFGKLSIFVYQIDSLIANPFHFPWVKTNMESRRLPVEYTYINDTLSIGLLMEAIGNSDYSMTTSKMNFQTGEIVSMPYEHPKIQKKRIAYAVSPEYGLFVEAYNYHDLLTICNMDGSLKYNVYGGPLNADESNKYLYCRHAIFCRDKIIVSFSGKERFINDEFVFPTKFHVYGLDGDYIKTLETHYPVDSFCYDKENHRLLMSLNDEMQFAYLDLDGLID